jgi:hypothetical protein
LLLVACVVVFFDLTASDFNIVSLLPNENTEKAETVPEDGKQSWNVTRAHKLSSFWHPKDRMVQKASVVRQTKGRPFQVTNYFFVRPSLAGKLGPSKSRSIEAAARVFVGLTFEFKTISIGCGRPRDAAAAQ